LLGLLVIVSILDGVFFFGDRDINFDRTPDRLLRAGVSNPGDVVYFQGHYVVTELLRNRLAIFDDLSLTNLRYFDPRSVGESFHSPHFLAVSPWGSLLISDGWGSSIIEITDLEGGGWRRFSGLGQPFQGPHGICADDEGWVYVGDSLNSRLVRFRDMEGKDWQVFADLDKRVSYSRELVCKDGAVWVSNSYERREGLNPGKGSNVLKISDFDAGRVEEVAAYPHSNMTGVLPLSNQRLLVGLWAGKKLLGLASAGSPAVLPLKGTRSVMGVPYGTFEDSGTGAYLVAYFGSLKNEGRNNPGGIAVYFPN